jgi:DNA gyrase inhibitor GyrI
LVVAIRIRKEPSYTVASLTRVGSYSGQDMMRKEFEEIMKWTKKRKLRTGKWFFYEHDGPETPDKERKWEACIEIRRKVQTRGKISVKKLPAQTVAAVKFNPEEVSAELVYYGIDGWLKQKKEEGKYEQVGPWREAYVDNPWTNAKAWAKAEVQAPVNKLKSKRK